MLRIFLNYTNINAIYTKRSQQHVGLFVRGFSTVKRFKMNWWFVVYLASAFICEFCMTVMLVGAFTFTSCLLRKRKCMINSLIFKKLLLSWQLAGFPSLLPRIYLPYYLFLHIDAIMRNCFKTHKLFFVFFFIFNLYHKSKR